MIPTPRTPMDNLPATHWLLGPPQPRTPQTRTRHADQSLAGPAAPQPGALHLPAGSQPTQAADPPPASVSVSSVGSPGQRPGEVRASAVPSAHLPCQGCADGQREDNRAAPMKDAPLAEHVAPTAVPPDQPQPQPNRVSRRSDATAESDVRLPGTPPSRRQAGPPPCGSDSSGVAVPDHADSSRCGGRADAGQGVLPVTPPVDERVARFGRSAGSVRAQPDGVGQPSGGLAGLSSDGVRVARSSVDPAAWSAQAALVRVVRPGGVRALTPTPPVGALDIAAAPARIAVRAIFVPHPHIQPAAERGRPE